MKVIVVRSFTGFVGENSISASEGQVIEMPDGADWVRAGLAVLLPSEDQAPETAAFEPSEAAVPKAPRKRKPK